MLIAFVVLAYFTARLAIRLRSLVRGDSQVTRADQWAIGVFVFMVCAGSAIVFLGSRAWVHHEAALWAGALALGGFEYVIACATTSNATNLLFASALTTAALLTRGVTG
jgi:hypothetical protein